MTLPPIRLISHRLCPYVQRAAIALLEKRAPFERIDVDLGDRPDWFVRLSPLGKVPLLVVDESTVLFESSVIAEYADRVTGGGLLAADPLEAARQKAWMEFASALIAGIGRLYNAGTGADLELAAGRIAWRLRMLESKLGTGPYFGGTRFSLVDAAFAPAFRYFDVLDDLMGSDLFADVPKTVAWRQSLAERRSVIDAVTGDYPALLRGFLARRDSILGRRSARRPDVLAA